MVASAKRIGGKSGIVLWLRLGPELSVGPIDEFG